MFSKSKNKEPEWPIGLVKQCVEQDALLYSGVRKIFQDMTWAIKALPQISYSDLGYSSNKHRQLVRNYWNQPEVDRVKTLLDKRKSQAFTSVALPLRNQTKDSRSQGHCMQSLIVTRAKGFESVEVQYRSTEVILKFGGDLVFLQSLFEELNLDPYIIRFRFANAFLSGVFFPTLCHWWDPIDFLEYLFENEPKLFAGGTRFFLRSAYREDQIFPFSPQQRQHLFGWEHLDMPRIARYLEKKHRSIGKSLPKIHYPSDERYIPRAKRKIPNT